MLDLARKRVLVLGLGDTGFSMARWLERQGAHVRVADSRENPPHAAKLARDLPDVALYPGRFQPQAFRDVNLIAVSPGVPLSDPLVSEARADGIEVVGDVELFARVLNAQRAAHVDQKQVKVIGITGSNGKSTVTSMVGALCATAGLETVVAGNIGLPVLDALPQHADSKSNAHFPEVYVLELSSFQLESTSSLRLDAATVLNLSEDHMDRYAGLAEYADAKARIFAHCGTQVVNRDDSLSLGLARVDARVFQFGLDEPIAANHWGIAGYAGMRWLADNDARLMQLHELPVAGLHNAANALAALALSRAIGLPYPPLLEALRRFRGLPHRVERVMELNGIAFYDDSKGTNVGATAAALKGMEQAVVLIAGGDGKGQNFSPLKEAVHAKARAVVLIGRDANLIAKAIEPSGVRQLRADDMAEAVALAYGAARAGDAVLLSPACASFDMFKNYTHRAQVFIEAVRALAARERKAAGGD
jgi:UDP-N-acetylmuramoylalanine--D-glutamate ligase